MLQLNVHLDFKVEHSGIRELNFIDSEGHEFQIYVRDAATFATTDTMLPAGVDCVLTIETVKAALPATPAAMGG